MGGSTYLHLVDQILPILEAGGVYVELDDTLPGVAGASGLGLLIIF